MELIADDHSQATAATTAWTSSATASSARWWRWKTYATDIVRAVIQTYAELDASFLEIAEKRQLFSGCTSNNVILIKWGRRLRVSVARNTRRPSTA